MWSRSNISKNSDMGALAQDKEGQPLDLSFHSIASSDPLKENLALSLTGNASPVLLVGEEGAGKHYAARRLAAALLCDRPDAGSGACGSCPSCRLMAAGAHHDLVELEPESGKTAIAVSDVRSKVAQNLQVFPQISRRRVYIISAVKAETLNEQSQNALLKPLEDHPGFVRFILMTEDADRLLPTILSRSRKILMGRRSDDAIRAILKEEGFEGREAELAISYADGLPGPALAIAGDEDFRDLRARLFGLFEKLPAAGRSYCLTEGLGILRDEKNRMPQVFRILESFLRDWLLLQKDLPNARLINSDLAGEIKKQSGRYPQADTGRAALLIRQTGRALSGNANFDHTAARLLLGLRAFLGGDEEAAGAFVLNDRFM